MAECIFKNRDVEYFSYNGVNYSIHRGVIDELNKVGIIVDGQYIDYLLKWRSPYRHNDQLLDTCLTALVDADLENRKVRSTLGRFVQYSQNGDYIQMFDSIYDIVTSPNAKQFLYGFEHLYKEGVILTRSNIDFFGIKFKPLYNQQSFLYRHITSLNCCVRENINEKDGVSAERVYNDPHFNVQHMAFEDFKEQRLRHSCFVSAYYRYPQKERYELSKQEYQTSLDGFLKRYSYENVSLFERVQNINDYKGCAGIYLLCFPDIRAFYIGQTQDCFVKRIKAHFQCPKTAFDISVGCSDVKDIYILKCPPKIIDMIEQDCIASISSNFLLNCLAGGNTVMGIKWSGYSTSDFLMSKKKLETTKEGLFEYRSIIKNKI